MRSEDLLIRKKIVFLCLGNSCRSIMAEAIAGNDCADDVEVASAGIHPLGYITEETTAVLREKGFFTDHLYSKGFEEIDLQSFQLLVNLTHYSLEGILPDSFKGKVINRYVPDPYGKSLNAFRQVRDMIEQMISEDLAVWVREVSLYQTKRSGLL